MSKFTFSCTCSRHGARQSDTSRAYDVTRSFRIAHRPACLANCACIRMWVCALHFARRAHARLARAALRACRPRRSCASSPSPGASLKTSRHMAATATTARFTKRSSPHLKLPLHSHLYAAELEHCWFTAHLAAHEPPVRLHRPATRARALRTPPRASPLIAISRPRSSSPLCLIAPATPTGACPPARARHAGACIHPPPGSGPPGALRAPQRLLHAARASDTTVRSALSDRSPRRTSQSRLSVACRPPRRRPCGLA
jgi:hypothetical protein